MSAGEGMTATTTAEGVYVLNNVTAGGYTIQVREKIIHVGITTFGSSWQNNLRLFKLSCFLQTGDFLDSSYMSRIKMLGGRSNMKQT